MIDRRSRIRADFSLEDILENFDLPNVDASKLELEDWLINFSKKQKTYFVQDQRLVLKESNMRGREV